MKQFHAYRLRQFSDALVLVLQSEFLDHGQMIVAPLESVGRLKPQLRINPEIRLQSEGYLVMLDHMTSIPRQEIGEEIASANAHRDAIKRGIDTLFDGF